MVQWMMDYQQGWMMQIDRFKRAAFRLNVQICIKRAEPMPRKSLYTADNA
jgi:hypothetical protein